jgi:C4-dicarboxylate-specific signal transduction histidine kinase
VNLEVASRAISRLAPDLSEKARGSLAAGQREVDDASRMIDVLPELARRVAVPANPFELGEALSRALTRSLPVLSARNLRPVFPTNIPPLPVIGSAEEVEQAFADVLAGAADEASAGECHVSLEEMSDGVRVAIRVPLREGGRAPGTFFQLSRRADGRSPGVGLFLARFTFEGLGGRIEAAAGGGVLTLTVALPAARG